MDVVTFQIEIGRPAIFADAHGRHDLTFRCDVRDQGYLLDVFRIKETNELVVCDGLQRYDDEPLIHPGLDHCAGDILCHAIIDRDNNRGLIGNDGVIFTKEDPKEGGEPKREHDHHQACDNPLLP